MITKANTGAPHTGTGRIGDSSLATRLSKELQGEILFDAASRGRYSTDASIYQVEPIGIVIPKGEEDIVCVYICKEREREREREIGLCYDYIC